MQLTEKTQQAYREYEAAKKARREIEKTINDAKASDTTLTDLEEAKKQAAGEYKAEAAQFEAKHERLYEQLDEAKNAEKEAKAIFDELYVHASAESIAASGASQLSLFSDDGRKVNIALVTKVSVEKEKQPEEPTDTSQDDAE
jgi:predicted nuclease with TOPRIM domain